VGHLERLVASAPQTLGQGGELAGGLSGYVVSGLPRPQLLRVLHEGTEDAQGLLRVSREVRQGELVDDYRSVGEVCVYLEAVEVADH
jgi:hypothetical protein